MRIFKESFKSRGTKWPILIRYQNYSSNQLLAHSVSAEFKIILRISLSWGVSAPPDVVQFSSFLSVKVIQNPYNSSCLIKIFTTQTNIMMTSLNTGKILCKMVWNIFLLISNGNAIPHWPRHHWSLTGNIVSILFY